MRYMPLRHRTRGRAIVTRRHPLPTRPGRYFWTEWGKVVDVVSRGKQLYVTPPCLNGQPVKVTFNIAGDFIPQEEA